MKGYSHMKRKYLELFTKDLHESSGGVKALEKNVACKSLANANQMVAEKLYGFGWVFINHN